MSVEIYLVIVNNEVVATSEHHNTAQESARIWSTGRYPEAKVIYLPNRTVQGIWLDGIRIQ